MIAVHRITQPDHELYVNPDLIQVIEANPDTVIVLANGNRTPHHANHPTAFAVPTSMVSMRSSTTFSELLLTRDFGSCATTDPLPIVVNPVYR